MFDLKDKIAEKLKLFLESIGTDPIFISTVICIIISILYIRESRNWGKMSDSRKLLAISTMFGTLILILISLLRLAGVITMDSK